MKHWAHLEPIQHPASIMRVFPGEVLFGDRYVWWTVVKYQGGVPVICGNQGFPKGQERAITRAGCESLAALGFEVVRFIDPDGRHREHDLRRFA